MGTVSIRLAPSITSATSTSKTRTGAQRGGESGGHSPDGTERRGALRREHGLLLSLFIYIAGRRWIWSSCLWKGSILRPIGRRAPEISWSRSKEGPDTVSGVQTQSAAATRTL